MQIWEEDKLRNKKLWVETGEVLGWVFSSNATLPYYRLFLGLPSPKLDSA